MVVGDRDAGMYGRMDEGKVGVGSRDDDTHMAYGMSVATSEEDQITLAQVAESATDTACLLALAGRSTREMDTNMTEDVGRESGAVERLRSTGAVYVRTTYRALGISYQLISRRAVHGFGIEPRQGIGIQAVLHGQSGFQIAHYLIEQAVLLGVGQVHGIEIEHHLLQVGTDNDRIVDIDVLRHVYRIMHNDRSSTRLGSHERTD